MGTTVVAVQAFCPLCGSPVLSVGRGGRVFEDEVHAIQIGGDLGRGYMLCDDCGILTDLSEGLTLN